MDVDLESLWLPFTHNRLFKKQPRLVVEAEGMYYTAADGRRILDGLSGLWCCNAGHRHPRIVEAGWPRIAGRSRRRCCPASTTCRIPTTWRTWRSRAGSRCGARTSRTNWNASFNCTTRPPSRP